jgi:hypothetical protein
MSYRKIKYFYMNKNTFGNTLNSMGLSVDIDFLIARDSQISALLSLF